MNLTQRRVCLEALALDGRGTNTSFSPSSRVMLGVPQRFCTHLRCSLVRQAECRSGCRVSSPELTANLTATRTDQNGLRRDY